MLEKRSRRRARSVATLLCILLLSGCAASFPDHPTHEGFGLRNFAKVTDGVYRSGQPNEEQLERLIEQYGIKSVVKLNGGDQPAIIPLVDAPRISGWSVISTRRAPKTEQIKAILDAIDCAPKPVLVHCLHGQDRTGLIIGLWRIRHGAAIAEAYTEMMRRGFHANYGGVWSAWLRETGWNKPDADPALVGALATKPLCPSQALAAATPQ